MGHRQLGSAQGDGAQNAPRHVSQKGQGMRTGKLKCAARTGAAAGVLVWGGVAWGDVTGYDTLTDWSSLAIAKTGEVAGLASSYSRALNTLDDYGHFDNNDAVQPDGLYLVRQINGPGVISRIWMPHLAANQGEAIKIFLDGSATPTIDTTVSQLLNGTYTYAGGSSGTAFRAPFTQTMIGGQVNYEPITFKTSARIEMSKGGGDFYQVDYHTLAPSANVTTFNGTVSSARATAATVLQQVGSNPADHDPAHPDAAAINVPLSNFSIPAGGTVPLANLTSSGQIRALNLQMTSGGVAPTTAELDGIRLRIRYDGSSFNSVDVPISQFFGVGHGRAAYQSLPLGVKGDGSYYSYWPMPFRAGARVELYNSTGTNYTVGSSAVEYKSGPVDSAAYYFRAFNQEQTTTAGQPLYHVLQCRAPATTLAACCTSASRRSRGWKATT